MIRAKRISFFLLLLSANTIVLAQYNGFKRDLVNHITQTHSKFSVTYHGDSKSFLENLNELVLESVDEAEAQKIIIKSYQYTVSYTADKSKVTFEVEYLDVVKNTFQERGELIDFVVKSLAAKKEYFEAGILLAKEVETQKYANDVFRDANTILEDTYKQLFVSSYLCNITSHDTYVELKFSIEYVLPELIMGLYAYSQDELQNIIHDHIVKRDTLFAIHILGGNEGVRNIEASKAYSESCGTDEYNKNSVKSTSFRSISFWRSKIIVFDMVYYANEKEENFIDQEVEIILSGIMKPGTTEEEKIKSIHDYIVLNIAYDNTKKTGSAYTALTTKRAVCYGYTLLAQKMFDKAGIKSIIINSEEMKHTWNLVNIEGNWYHLDITWDDPIPDVAGRILYDYYLKSDYEMMQHPKKNHQWIRSDYPRAKESYNF